MISRFIVDSMLGRLARWLRVMGYDTHYQSFYKGGEIEQSIHTGRLLLTRDKKLIHRYKESVFIRSDHVGEQLRELSEYRNDPVKSPGWFSRCLICNVPLRKALGEEAKGNVPDYIYTQNDMEIMSCPSCGRFFWPGSHRDRMISQLKKWGFSLENTNV